MAYDTFKSPAHTGDSPAYSNSDRTLKMQQEGDQEGMVLSKGGKSSGKWYLELLVHKHAYMMLGIVPSTSTSDWPGYAADEYGYDLSEGDKMNNNVWEDYDLTYQSATDDDIVMLAWDADNGKVYMGRNGTWFSSGDPAAGSNPAYSGISGTYYFALYLCGGAVYYDHVTVNCGQEAFEYTPPSGFSGWTYEGPVEITAPLAEVIVTGYAPVFAGYSIQSPVATITVEGGVPTVGLVAPIPLAEVEVYGLTSSYKWSVPAGAVIRSNVIFICVLTGTEDGLDDLEIPMSSFQARLRDGTPSYVAAYIPDVETYSDDIIARPNGEILIRKGYLFSDGTRQLETIARVDYEDLRYDIGAYSSTGVISGHRTESATSAKTVAMSGVSYECLQDDGKRRVRCDVDLFLRPGDTATWSAGEDQIVVGQIAYVVNPTFAWMEITEA